MPQQEQRRNGNEVVNANNVPMAPLRRVLTGARTLTADDNGAICLFNTAAGYTITLPAASPGLYFDFAVTTTITSVGAKVICASGDFLLGTIWQIIDTSYAPTARAANGSTHVSWNGDGTTTGGYAGDTIRVMAISDTQWHISGFNVATGSEATPFSTS